MLDLNKIAKKIDEVLEAESSDSLTNWLMSKRNKELNVILGDGQFVSMSFMMSTICSSSSVEIKVQSEYEVMEDSYCAA